MAEFPAMPLWTDAYLGDTVHLTTIEHGAYLLLLMTMWRSKEKRLKNDDKLLARYARLTPKQWDRIKPVLEPFFDAKDGHWTQGRLTDEANAVKRNSRKQSDKAKARWLKNKELSDAAAMPERCRSDASLTLTLTTDESKDSSIKDQFDQWYSEYPRKVAKGAARKAFTTAAKKASFEVLMEAVKSYASKMSGKEAEFIAHPATWLNGERWLDVERVNGADGSLAGSLERRVEIAKDWLSRVDDIPTWMDKLDTAEALVKEGYDYDKLRRAGFSLPIRGRVVDIGDAVAEISEAKRAGPD